jgi:hypothetical protein
MGSVLADLLFWMALPLSIAVGAAALVWLLMQARLRVLTARFEAEVERVEHAAELQIVREVERARRTAFEELISDLRVEQRRALKKTRGLLRDDLSVVVQERLLLRSIPLTGWVQENAILPAQANGSSCRPIQAQVGNLLQRLEHPAETGGGHNVMQ